MAHPEQPRDQLHAEDVGGSRVERREVVSRTPGSLSEERSSDASDERDVEESADDRRGGGTRVASAPDVAAQRERFGGLKIGAAFFGWLCATGVAVLLAALLSAGGAALALTDTVTTAAAKANAATIGIGGGILLVVVLAIAYFAGGYVAGRLARFDGARQGLGVWIIGVVLAAAFAIAGWLFGSDYNVLSKLNLPNIPLKQGSVTTGGVIALIALALATLIAAVIGGRFGERYHRKIDRAAYPANEYAY